MESENTNRGVLEMTKIAIGVSSIFHAAKALKEDIETPIFIDAACNITGYAKATIYCLISRKEILFHKVAGRQKVFFYKSELLDWMNNRTKVKEAHP
jgi:excisionase family DNA binding protein